jgi:hypothetical protein
MRTPHRSIRKNLSKNFTHPTKRKNKLLSILAKKFSTKYACGLLGFDYRSIVMLAAYPSWRRKAMKQVVAMAVAVALGLLVALPASAAFSGIYDVANWSTTLTGFPPGGGIPAGVDTSGAPDFVILNGGDESCTFVTVDNCTVRFTVLAQNVRFRFHWDYVTQDAFGASQDLFGYLINSQLFQLTNDAGSPVQSGTTSVALNAGDTFGFYLDCLFCDSIAGGGPANVRVSDFEAPEPDSVALFGIAAMGLLIARRRAIKV